MIWQRPPSDGCPSNLALDRLLGQELDEVGRRAALDHIDRCARCGPRFRKLGAERDEFRAAPPPLWPATRAPAPRRRLRMAALGAAGALAAAAVLLLILVRLGPDARLATAPRPGSPLGAGVAGRVKGGLRLVYYLRRKATATVLEGRSGDAVHPGDAIRFAYSSPDAGYLVILSRDGAGRISVYYPDGERAAPVRPADEELVPGSIVLDGVLGPEVIHGVHCGAPVLVADVVEALGRSAGEALAIAGCTTDRLILDKD